MDFEVLLKNAHRCTLKIPAETIVKLKNSNFEFLSFVLIQLNHQQIISEHKYITITTKYRNNLIQIQKN